MSLDEIKTLIEAMASSDLAEMEVGKDGWTLRLVRRGAMALAEAARPRIAEPEAAPCPGLQTLPAAMTPDLAAVLRDAPKARTQTLDQ